MVKDKDRCSYFIVAALDVTTKDDTNPKLSGDKKYEMSEEKLRQFIFKVEKLAVAEGYLLNIFDTTPELNEPLYNVVLQEFDLDTTVKEKLKIARKLKSGGYYDSDSLVPGMYRKILDKNK